MIYDEQGTLDQHRVVYDTPSDDAEMIEHSYEAPLDRKIEERAYEEFMGDQSGNEPFDPATDDPDSHEYKLRHNALLRKPPETHTPEDPMVKVRRALPDPSAIPVIDRGSLNEMVIRVQVANGVQAERQRQDAKWGEQNHDPFTWLTILMEEVGETAQEALRAHFGTEPAQNLAHYRTEMIQVAAVAVAAVECLDRATLTES